MRKRTLESLLLILTSSLISCAPGGVKVDAYKADVKFMGVVNEEGDIVRCYDHRFNNFACFKKEDIKKITDELQRRRLPW